MVELCADPDDVWFRLKGFLKDKNAAFGVDLLLPQVGGTYRHIDPFRNPQGTS